MWLKKRVERKVPAILKPSSKVDKVSGTLILIGRDSSSLSLTPHDIDWQRQQFSEPHTPLILERISTRVVMVVVVM